MIVGIPLQLAVYCFIGIFATNFPIKVVYATRLFTLFTIIVYVNKMEKLFKVVISAIPLHMQFLVVLNNVKI